MTMKLFSRTDGKVFSPISKKHFAAENLERTLEDWLETNPHLLGGNIFLIGRQVRTDHGIIDLLALDSKGNTVIIELKRGRASRDVVGQINSYLTIVNRWSEAELVRNANLVPYSRETNNLIKSFKEHFKCVDVPEFNEEQVGIVVAEEYEEDFVPQIGGLRFQCRVLQFSNFAATKGEEYLLINTLYDSADTEETESYGRATPGESEFLKVPGNIRENFYALVDSVYDLLKEDSCPEASGWRLHKSGTFVQAVFSRWQTAYEGFSIYYEPATGKKYIATNCLPKHNKILAAKLHTDKKRIESVLGPSLRWDISSWETISEYVGDDPAQLADRISQYIETLSPYLDEALPPRGSGRFKDVTTIQLDYWKEFIDYAKGAGTTLNFRPPRARGYIILSFEKQLLVGIASQNRIAVYLAIKGENRDKIFKKLTQEADSLTKEFGGELKFEPLPHRMESQVLCVFPSGKLLDRNTWPEAHKWMLKALERFKIIFGQRLRKMQAQA